MTPLYYDEDLNQTAKNWFVFNLSGDVARACATSLRFARFEPKHLAQALGQKAADSVLSINIDNNIYEASRILGRAIAHMNQDNFVLSLQAFKKELSQSQNDFTDTIEPGLYTLNSDAREHMGSGINEALDSSVAHAENKRLYVLTMVTDYEKKSIKKKF